jgi:amino acid adenylation domain-containing protein
MRRWNVTGCPPNERTGADGRGRKAPVSDLPDPALEQGERREYPRDRTLQEQVVEWAERTPDAPALRFGDQDVTYRELVVQARRVGLFLRNLGVRRNSVVAVLDRASPRTIVTFLGVLFAGGAYLPLDDANPPERNLGMVRGSAADIMLVADDQLDRYAGAIPVSAVDEARTALWAAGEPDELPLTGTALDPAYVMYTSGSTGAPKGIIVPHRAIARLVVNTDYIDIRPGDVIAQASNLSFDASTFEIWGALLNGALLVGMPKESLLVHQELSEFLARHQVTALFVTTAVFHLHAGEAPAVFRTLRSLLMGGETSDPRAVRAVLAAGPPGRLLHMYGPTEATSFSTWALVTPQVAARDTLMIGRPIANTDVCILAGNRRAGPGEAGELHIGGDGLALGYVNDPELTAARFVSDPQVPGRRLYRTGDLARWNEEGGLDFLGRSDSQVKLRGFRIELGEIETLLRQHPAVTDASVVVVTDKSDAMLIAYVATCQPAAVTALGGYLAASLPLYMVPSRIVPVERLPLNANGKVDRARLAAHSRA